MYIHQYTHTHTHTKLPFYYYTATTNHRIYPCFVVSQEPDEEATKFYDNIRPRSTCATACQTNMSFVHVLGRAVGQLYCIIHFHCLRSIPYFMHVRWYVCRYQFSQENTQGLRGGILLFMSLIKAQY